MQLVRTVNVPRFTLLCTFAFVHTVTWCGLFGKCKNYITQNVTPVSGSTTISSQTTVSPVGLLTLPGSHYVPSFSKNHNASDRINSTEDTALATWNVVESDMLIPKLTDALGGGIEYGATANDVRLWGKDSATGNYVVPFLNDPQSPTISKWLKWVKTYISRGVNIEFREKRYTDIHWAEVTQIPGSCQSNIGRKYRGGASINLPESHCDSIHMILHEVLHLLGVRHEHGRYDRPTYIQGTGENFFMARHTEFDPYSVMMYTTSKMSVSGTDEELKPFRARRSFMSTCDWNFLLTLYPGPNKPPKCQPDKIANLLSPAPNVYFYSYNDGASDWNMRCHLYNEHRFDRGECVLPNGQEFPDLKKEFFSDDAIDLLQDKGPLRKKKKPETTPGPKPETTLGPKPETTPGPKPETTPGPKPETTPGPKPETKPKKQNAKRSNKKDARSSSDNIGNDRSTLVFQKKFHFCESFISRNTSVLTHEQCFSACQMGCKMYVPEKSLTKCLKEEYSPCKRQRQVFSSSLSHKMSLIALLLLVSTWLHM